MSSMHDNNTAAVKGPTHGTLFISLYFGCSLTSDLIALVSFNSLLRYCRRSSRKKLNSSEYSGRISHTFLQPDSPFNAGTLLPSPRRIAFTRFVITTRCFTTNSLAYNNLRILEAHSPGICTRHASLNPNRPNSDNA